LISFTIFTSCNKEELEDGFVPADEELVNDIAPVEEEEATYQAEKYGDTPAGRADFTVNNEDNTLLETDDLLLTNNSVNAVSYLWEFGNGDTSTEANPIYNNYKMHGNRIVTLTVTDALGTKHKVSQDVTVLCIFGGAPHEF